MTSDQYIAEVNFASPADVQAAIREYNRRACSFQSGLSELAHTYADVLREHNGGMGVATIDNIEACTIRLKALPAHLPGEMQAAILALFSTTWSL